MSFGWEGKKVWLVPLDKPKHFKNYVRWLSNHVAARPPWRP